MIIPMHWGNDIEGVNFWTLTFSFRKCFWSYHFGLYHNLGQVLVEINVIYTFYSSIPNEEAFARNCHDRYGVPVDIVSYTRHDDNYLRTDEEDAELYDRDPKVQYIP